jgi:hypothetical protein
MGRIERAHVSGRTRRSAADRLAAVKVISARDRSPVRLSSDSPCMTLGSPLVSPGFAGFMSPADPRQRTAGQARPRPQALGALSGAATVQAARWKTRPSETMRVSRRCSTTFVNAEARPEPAPLEQDSLGSQRTASRVAGIGCSSGVNRPIWIACWLEIEWPIAVSKV